MNAAARSSGRSRAEQSRQVMVGSTVVTAALIGLMVKAVAGMRGQTVRELVRGADGTGGLPAGVR